MYNNYNKPLPDGTFPEDLRTVEVVPVFKKKIGLTKIKDPSEFCQIFQKAPSTIQCMTILTGFYQRRI